MKIRQLIGPYAGQIQEMEYTAAQSCIAAGTACVPGDEAEKHVTGLVVEGDDAAAPSEPEAEGDSGLPEGWQELKASDKMKLALALTGEKPKNGKAAHEVLQAMQDAEAEDDAEE